MNIFSCSASNVKMLEVHSSMTYSTDFFHCSTWESSQICGCTVFSYLFFGYFFVKIVFICFLFCQIIINYIIEKNVATKQLQCWYLIPQVSTFWSSFLYLRSILWIPTERFNNELVINLSISIIVICKIIFFVICSPFLSILVIFFFYWNSKSYLFFSILSWTSKLFFKFFF